MSLYRIQLNANYAVNVKFVKQGRTNGSVVVYIGNKLSYTDLQGLSFRIVGGVVVEQR